ncbi:tumor necrosis factor receptor superfamily member 1B isoform X2 [Varanus komodoensis]|uniref:TNF receptor superfamily member 1B n=1 Tax=Varanus komodoensis TaxID=61221 RepID=A0A8D2LL17_VARKO|nr:tumor necrosis factor receptor superfamily member 1B isoform X2 [Varanus komodoensis]
MWNGRGAARPLLWALQLALAQAYLLPYTPQNREECKNPHKEHFVEAINKCCSLCPPGSRVLKSCSEDADTKCIPCEEGMFTKTWSRAERCFSCRPQCNGGLVQVRACNRTQDLFCWCPAHQFCGLKHSDECIYCQAYTRCDKGHGVVQPGSPTSDVQCAPCPEGTFSDVESDSATCRPHRLCKSRRFPGSSTSDAVCADPNGSPGIFVTPPRSTTVAKPTWDKATKAPTLDIKQATSTDLSSTVGWVAGMMFVIVILLGGVFLVFAFRKRVHKCAPPCGKEKQACSANAKMSGSWPQASGPLSQEEQTLLQTSASSSSLDSPPGSDKSSGCSVASALPSEEESSQERPLPDSPGHHGRTELKPSGNRGTHVNVSCIVSVCNADHSLPFQSLSAPAADSGGCSSAADLPLSKEESVLKREPGRQIAVEVEDSMGIFDYNEGKALPLSIQDVGMKTT